MQAAQLMVQALEAEGVEYIFGLPGEENLDFLEALSNSAIQFILTRHEQEAAFMAATYGRLTGRVGVCFSTLGPGATNLMTGAAYAQLGGMPLLMITGQKPIHYSKQGRFQILDVVEMMRPVTKRAESISAGGWVPSAVRNAFRSAQENPPGAVHLELPEDVAEENSPVNLIPIAPQADPRASQTQLDACLKRLLQAQNPLVMVGASANRKKSCRALAKFIETSQIPFFTTQMGKGSLDERHALCLGTVALSEGEIAHQALEQADLILVLGYDAVEKLPFTMKKNGPEVMHIHHSAPHSDPQYFPQFELQGEIVASLNFFRQHFEKEPPRWSHAQIQGCLEQYQQRLNRILNASNPGEELGISPLKLIQEIRAFLPPEGIVTLDNGMYKLWFARYYPAFQPLTLLLDNALASMGAGVPSAMATALLQRARPVIAVCGDGGFLMNSQSLETAVRLKLNLIIIVLQDDRLGMIRWKQHQDRLKDFGLSFGNPDFVQLAQSYGAQGHAVKRLSELQESLKRAQATQGVHLLDVLVDYSENESEF